MYTHTYIKQKGRKLPSKLKEREREGFQKYICFMFMWKCSVYSPGFGLVRKKKPYKIRERSGALDYNNDDGAMHTPT